MKNLDVAFNRSLIIQILENNKYELLVDYIEYLFLLVCSSLSLIVMMLIPVVLLYSMVSNFINMSNCNNEINKEMCRHDNNSKYLEPICRKYLKSSSYFFKNFMGLAAWNIFSLIYIVIGFNSFSNGLREYFYFPFAVFQSLSKNEIFNTIHKFQANWLFMLTIIILTFSFYFLGKYIGRYVAKSAIKNKGLIFSLS